MQITDQTGQTLYINQPPGRIISVVPSQTELLFSLGLEIETIGITKFCIHPQKWHQSKTRVGGTKTLNLPLIEQLKPEFILANKEENNEEQIKSLCRKYPVYISDIKNLDDSIKMIEDVGLLTGKSEKAATIVQQINNNFNLLVPANNIRTAYLIWQKPYMAAGGDTFISEIMGKCGFKNVLSGKNRYPEITIEELNLLNCELLLLSSEPFPFDKKHAEEIKTAGFKGEIMLVDGKMFSWYGSRLILAPSYFQSLVDLIKNS